MSLVWFGLVVWTFYDLALGKKKPCHGACGCPESTSDCTRVSPGSPLLCVQAHYITLHHITLHCTRVSPLSPLLCMRHMQPAGMLIAPGPQLVCTGQEYPTIGFDQDSSGTAWSYMHRSSICLIKIIGSKVWWQKYSTSNLQSIQKMDTHKGG